MSHKIKNPNPHYCAASVHDDFGADFHQCVNKRRLNSEFCGTHSPEAQARRDAKSEASHLTWKNKILAPSRRIEHLEAINADLLAALELGCEHGRLMTGPQLLEWIANKLIELGTTEGVGVLRAKAEAERAAIAKAEEKS